MKSNIVKDKSFKFAIRIVNLYKYLTIKKKEFVLSKQILRSGTSVGAMISEAEYAETKKDFAHKMSIAQKETNETIYWLKLLKTTDYIAVQEFERISNDATEILKLLTSSLRTAKKSLNINQ